MALLLLLFGISLALVGCPAPDPTPGDPLPPGSFEARVEDQAVRLTWTTVEPAATQTVIYRAEAEASLSSAQAYSEIARVGPSVESYTDDSIAPGRSYWYAVRTLTSDGYSEYVETAQPIAVPEQVEDVSLSVALDGSGGGVVTSSPSGIDCSGNTGDCSETFSEGTQVVLTAVPDGDSALGGWSGCDQASGSECTVTLAGDTDVTATFVDTSGPGAFPLQVTVAGSGDGFVRSNPDGLGCGGSCSYFVEAGAVFTLTAEPSAGSTFESWSGCDSVSGPTCTISMTGSRNVTASFASDPGPGPTQRNLAVTLAGSGSGDVTSSPAGIDCGSSCSEDFDDGTVVTLTASADAGSSFDGWSGCDSTSGTQCTVSMDSDVTVTATFVSDPLDPAIVPTTSTCGSAGVGSSCTVTVDLVNNSQSWSGAEFDVTNPSFTLDSVSTPVGGCFATAGPTTVGIICGSSFSGEVTLATVTFTRDASGASTFTTSAAGLLDADANTVPVDGGTLLVP
jgi:hypothetical protein